MNAERTGGLFDLVHKDGLLNRSGIRFLDFRKTLTPRYRRAWLELLAGHVSLLIIGAILVIIGSSAPLVRVPLMAAGAILFGYVLAYINLFFHEAAHFNLAADRQWNDRLSNLLIGSLSGEDIAEYRSRHFEHHRRLGQPDDTEHSYFDPLDMRFVAESMLGVKALRLLASREALARSSGAALPARWRNLQRAVALTVNGAIVVGAFAWHWWYLGLAWALGVAMFFPFFLEVRQLLEHRDENATRGNDYTQVPHGIINRIFGDGLLASTLGGAGFNRHLLHHWEPQISYTRLRELEQFVRQTELADALEARTTTYPRTLAQMFRA